ncbi:hypothetical protein EYF80_047506 [Liparis tanakae]|uniref:Uncharacterized protein n=1 Tax=Liparis tanakae TaxID=230148 RepID=A0A4Z2FN67_9TELE|nr:hypothetical protein EYF80_047506 [Liparis tanakae]
MKSSEWTLGFRLQLQRKSNMAAVIVDLNCGTSDETDTDEAFGTNGRTSRLAHCARLTEPTLREETMLR